MVETRATDIVRVEPAAPATGRARLPVVDAARGVALLAMAVFHFTWDLGFFGFIELRAGVDPGWRMFARAIAGSFLALVGVSLVLAARGGLRSGPYLRRLAMIAAAAAAITLATWWAMPEGIILFGILHCIAVSSVLALPFVRAPLWLVAAVAALCLALPLFATSPAFDSPWLLWLGLAEHVPPSNDYEPLLPWFGMVLVGVLAARLALATGVDGVLARWRGEGPVGRVLRALGRHSLAFYLVHQPVFFALLWTLATLAPSLTHQVREAPQDPVLGCRLTCEAQGGSTQTCTSLCTCMVTRLAGTGLAEKPEGAVTEAERRRIVDTAEICRKEAEPPQ